MSPLLSLILMILGLDATCCLKFIYEYSTMNWHFAKEFTCIFFFTHSNRPFLLESPNMDVRLSFAKILERVMCSFLSEHGGLPVSHIYVKYFTCKSWRGEWSDIFSWRGKWSDIFSQWMVIRIYWFNQSSCLLQTVLFIDLLWKI